MDPSSLRTHGSGPLTVLYLHGWFGSAAAGWGTEFVDTLDLNPDIRKAVLYRKGSLGRVLRVAITLEQAIALETGLESLDTRLLKIYDQSASRVQRLLRELQSP